MTRYPYKWFYPRYADGRCHEPLATRRFLDEVTKSKVVVDVGANLGWFTCIAASMNRTTKVYSFELDAVNYELCLRNIKLNHLNNVCLENTAVTNVDDELKYEKESRNFASTVHRLGKKASISVTVEGIRLDSHFSDKNQPELLKIDVEGAEQLVLEGMEDILRGDSLRTIFIEIHPKWLTDLGGIC